MSVRVISEKSALTTAGGTVVVESDREGADAYTELAEPAARNLAIQYAATQGVPDPRISGNVRTYPVDAAGTELSAPGQKFVAIRADVPITRKLL